MKKTLFALLVFLSSILIISCNKDTNDDNPPTLPPESSIVIDASNFQQKSINIETKAGTNWLFSAINVGVWNAVITVGMAVPIAAFRAVVSTQPEAQDNGTWLWQTSFNNTYSAKLYGSVDGDKVLWDMYISKTDDYQDFLWFSGESDINGTQGQWIFYKNPNDNKKLLQINWEYSKTDSVGSAKFMNIEEGGSEYGGYIIFGRTDRDDYDSYYTIYNKGKDELTQIEWNSAKHNGRVKAPHHFNDEAWHCWDENLNNVDCQ